MEGIWHGFDWDAGNTRKCQKHGASIAEIEALFVTGALIQFPNLKHSSTEARYSGIGRTSAGRGVFVVFTFRERDGARLIRPISARYMHAWEIDYYESL